MVGWNSVICKIVTILWFLSMILINFTEGSPHVSGAKSLLVKDITIHENNEEVKEALEGSQKSPLVPGVKLTDIPVEEDSNEEMKALKMTALKLSQKVTLMSHNKRPYNVQIKDLVAIVTGGAQGLGQNFVEHLLKENAKVAFGGPNDVQGRNLEIQYSREYGAENVLFCTLDVTKQESFENIFTKAKEKFGGIDLLVNNAGVGYEDKDNWEKTIDINFKGSVRGQLLAIKHMGKHNGGRGGTVVMISSRTALIPGFLWPLYSTTKKAQIAYTEAMGNEFYENHFNIRTMSLCPGLTDSQLPNTQADNPFIPELKPILMNRTSTAIRQSPASVSKALLQIVRNGTTGTTWVVENDEAPRPIHFWNDF